MAYFDCTIGSAGEFSIPLVVTCTANFAGQTITCSDGTTTLTGTCPSASPYEVEFELSNTGTWTVSGVVEGTTYSQQVVITDFDVTLTAGFDYKQWVTLGGLDPTDYTDLEDVFADEVAVRRLMTIHASADYLIEKVTDDVDTIDDFTANDIAMKWIGLRDYVCDGLTAITGVEAKFLASDYWERYLKDHVPTMTSNSAPYGTVSFSPTEDSNRPAWKVFDGDTSTGAYFATNNSEGSCIVKFTNPINVRIFSLLLTNSIDYTFQVFFSDDGTNFTSAGGTFAYSVSDLDTKKYFKLDSDYGYHLYWKVTRTISTTGSAFAKELQLYGRSLNVSVPVMTSNTAPYGTVSATSILSGNDAYRAFDGNDSTQAMFASNTTNNRLVYKFTNPICVKRMYWLAKASQAMPSDKPYIIQGSNDGSTWVDLYNGTYPKGNEYVMVDIDNNDYYLYYGVFCPEVMYVTSSWACGFYTFQFYGVDYSEREFAEGSTMKYLYDHGVELETFIAQKGSSTTSVSPSWDGEELYFSPLAGTNNNRNNFSFYETSYDLTNFDLLRATFGFDFKLCFSIAIFSSAQSRGTYDTNVANISPTSITLPNTDLALDISSIDQTEYIDVGVMYVNGRSGSIKELWLE